MVRSTAPRHARTLVRVVPSSLALILGLGALAGCGSETTSAADVSDAMSDTSNDVSPAVDTGPTNEDTFESDEASADDTTAGDAADADTPPADTTAAPLVTRTVTIGPFSVPSGVERTMCAAVDLGNTEPGVIRAIRTSLSPGSHHLIVHRLDEPAAPTPTPCSAFAHGMGQQVLFIAQQREAGLDYPDGAGLPVPAHQTIGLEMHFINYFATDQIDIVGTVEFDLAPAGTLADEVHVLFTGSLGFTIPAASQYTLTSWFPVPTGTRIFGLTSHTHQLGTRATIRLTRGPGDGGGTLLHESTDWAEPPLTLFDPVLVTASGQGLRLACEFDNPNPYPVSFGLGFEDEMCFLWLYYLE